VTYRHIVDQYIEQLRCCCRYCLPKAENTDGQQKLILILIINIYYGQCRFRDIEHYVIIPQLPFWVIM